MLNDILFLQPGHLIRRAHQLAWAVFMDEARDFELTPVQYSTLLVISFNPGIDATRLSELVSFDRATIGNVVERMEAKGLLKRKAGLRDRRTKKMFLTAQGKKVVAGVKPLAPRIADRILDRLNARERSQLLQLLGKLVDIRQIVETAEPASVARRRRRTQ